MSNASNGLLEQLAAPENLMSAWRSVRGNIPGYRRQRSAGPDGVSMAEFERDLSTQLMTLRHMLLKGRYQPQRPGLIAMPKRGGGTRQIAVLNIADRVAQRAAQQVIELLYEPTFLPCNFGYRPGRSIQDAVYCAKRLRASGYAWVVDGDIAACFDSLDHRFLLEKVSGQLRDERVIGLLHRWLEIGVLENGLPPEKPNWVKENLEKASRHIASGVEWAAGALGRGAYGDAYAPAAYERIPYPAEKATYPGEWEGLQADPYSGRAGAEMERNHAQKMALQQIAAGGLMLGGGWLRRGLSKAAPLLIGAIKSRAGRELLSQGLMLGGGALGAAAGLALTGYFVYRQVAPAQAGILQGSPLSPLLSNIYLHAFDQALTQDGYRLVRFADDWAIFCPDRTSAETAYNRSVLALANIHLKVNTQKTHILAPADPLEWLGEVIA